MQHHASGIAAGPRRVRPVLVLAAAAAFALGACSAGGASPSAAPAGPTGEPTADVTFEGTSWQLTAYVAEGAASVPVPQVVAATATFEGGTVSGNGGCNNYSGPYTLDGDTIEIGNVASTMMACEGPAGAVESAYLAILPKMTTVAVSGETLTLTGPEGKLSLEFKVAETAGLTGTRWAANSINNGNNAVVSVVAGTEPTAIFAEDGQVAGSGGCNTFTATYTVDGASISFGPIASTKMACEQAAMDQETAYFNALAATTTYTISGESLELRDDSGALQVGYTATVEAP